MQKTHNKLRVKEGKTELTVDHNDQDLTFIHPNFGPDTYANVGSYIEQAGLKRPSMAETASLVHTAFNSDDKYSNEIQKLVRGPWLWGFTGTLYVAGEGVYIQDDPETREGMLYMDRSELVKKLEQNDPSVRFVKFGFPIGSMAPMQFAKNEYVRALAGDEGAEKLAEIAKRHRNKPYLWSLEYVDNPITGVSTLHFGTGYHGLVMYGSGRGDKRYGYAFGVLPKASEASHKK